MSVAEIYPEFDDAAATRVPPQNIDAERSVLGAMLLSKDAIDAATEVLAGRDFYQPAHEAIYESIVELYSASKPVDAVTVAAEMQRTGDLQRVGGAPYLHTLVSGVPVASNAAYYAEIVHEKAVLRRLVEVGTRIAHMGYLEQGDLDSIVDRAQAEVYSVTEHSTSEDFAPLSEIIGPTFDELEAIEGRDGDMAGVPTGFAKLDELTHGFHRGQMIVVAARPGVGKSTLGLDFCRNASIKHGLRSAIFSLEMSRVEITMRLLSAESKVSLNAMRGGKLGDNQWALLADRTGAISEAQIYIDDSPNLTMMEIRAKARRIKKRHGLDFVVIDYLQLMTSGKRVENRQVEVSEFSRQIKLLAKELDIPIVAISQLNRGSEQRTDKRPQLSDLRESGAIEQDADIVLLLHRPELYERDPGNEIKGEAEFIVAKNRSGTTGTVNALFQGDFSRFVEASRQPEPASDAPY